MEDIGKGSSNLPQDRDRHRPVEEEAGQLAHDPRDLRGSQRAHRSANEDESNREGGPPERDTSPTENRIDPASVQSRVEK